MSPAEINRLVKQLAFDLRFDSCGVTRAEKVPRESYIKAWLQNGRNGEMEYLRRNFAEMIEPAKLLPGAKSIIVVAVNYYRTVQNAGSVNQRDRRIIGRTPASDCALDNAAHANVNSSSGHHGRVAMYAWGDDYHVVIRKKLESLEASLRSAVDVPFEVRICVDAAPIVEREFAALAGIGWIGKNTLVLNAELGSYFFLGEMITTLVIAPDEPSADHCGSCTACLDACPTSAFPEPYQMDAARCISYLTIEHRGPIAAEFHRSMGDWVFGCDICQEVCPFNRRTPMTKEPGFAERAARMTLPLESVLSWSKEEYRREVGNSAIRRAKLEMLQRNARIVMENHAEIEGRRSHEVGDG